MSEIWLSAACANTSSNWVYKLTVVGPWLLLQPVWRDRNVYDTQPVLFISLS